MSFLTSWSAAAPRAPELLAHLRPGMDLLDRGCGPGTITVGLARAVAPGAVTAVDREPEQVALAFERARAEGSPVRGLDADVYALPLAAASFDAVHTHALIEHLADPLAALGELRRVLRPGGILAATVPDFGASCWLRPARRPSGGAPRLGAAEPGMFAQSWVTAVGRAPGRRGGAGWAARAGRAAGRRSRSGAGSRRGRSAPCGSALAGETTRSGPRGERGAFQGRRPDPVEAEGASATRAAAASAPRRSRHGRAKVSFGCGTGGR